MAIIPRPPESVWDCPVLAKLGDKSTPVDGATEKVRVFIETATPLVDLIIAGPFKEYTLHNRDHSKKILHLVGHVVPAATLEQLSCLEHVVLVYAAYLHDMGMSLTATERERIVSSDDFSDVMQESQDIWDALQSARAKLETTPGNERFSVEAEIYQLEEAGLAAYLRPRHAEPQRYRELVERLRVQSNRQDLFEYRGASFEEPLIEICASHNLEPSTLAEVSSPYEGRFPRALAIGGAYLNAQFCAAVLRLCDVLDFDRERTPRILFESLGISNRTVPGAELSIREWQKHMAVHTIEVNKDEVIVSADSHHPVIEKAVRDSCEIIEREIRDTLAVLKRNPPEVLNRYDIELPLSVRPRVASVGYVFRDMALTLNQPRIMSLLMGERLYANPAAAVRELVENAIDACAARLKLEGPPYRPEISVRLVQGTAGSSWIEVTDNGLGMDEHVLSEYFLKLGNSYYSSPEFSRLIRGGSQGYSFTPISRFGIGIISVFLIADVLEVHTRSARSPRRDTVARCLRIEKMGALAFVTESESAGAGTRIMIRLRPKYADPSGPFLANLPNYLRAVVLRPRFPLSIQLLEPAFELKGSPGIKLKPNALRDLASRNVELIMLDVGRWSDRFVGTVGVLLAKTDDGKLSHLQNGKYLRLGKAGIDPLSFLVEFSGNRVTVNGFAMAMKKLGRVLGKGKNRLALLFDLEIVGDERVDYDISRERIVGAGRQFVLAALEEAISNGLRDTGVLDRLAPETLCVIDVNFRREGLTTRAEGGFFPWRDSELRPGDPQNVLDSVERTIPTGDWPHGLHKIVARKLGISNGLAVRAINTLIKLGRISRPSKKVSEQGSAE